jgi:hypothetical protein
LADFFAQIAAILLGLTVGLPVVRKQGIATPLSAIGVAEIGIENRRNEFRLAARIVD